MSALAVSARFRRDPDGSKTRPGMVGIGHTVFDGTHVEEFKVNIPRSRERHRAPPQPDLARRWPWLDTGVIAG
jgi:hypothetical protein